MSPIRAFVAVVAALLLALLALVVTPQPALARPMAATLDEVLDDSPRIVVATFLGPVDPTLEAWQAPTHRLEVESVLRGQGAPGEWVVARSELGGPAVAVGARVVAFLDAEDRWTFAALPQEPNLALDRTWFRLAGFYDFNAYLVSPSVLTWAQLEAAIAGKQRPDYRFEGALEFIDPVSHTLSASDLTLTVTVESSGDAGKVAGMPRAEGLPKQPEILVSPGWEPDLALTWSRELSRPLEVTGTITGFDADSDTFRVRLRVASPELYTRALFDAFLADADASAPVWTIEVALEGGGVLTYAQPQRGTQGRLEADAAATAALALEGELRTKHFMYAPRRELAFATDAGGLLAIACEPPVPPVALLDERGPGTQLYQELLLTPGLACEARVEDAAGTALHTVAATMRLGDEVVLRQP